MPGYVEVHLRRRQLRVAQEVLDRPDVDAERWWRWSNPVRGSAETRDDGNANCHPNARAAQGCFRT